MQILASADLHGDLGIYEWLVGMVFDTNPDVLVLAGDLLDGHNMIGTIEEAQRSTAFEILNIIGRVTQPVLYVMGNDDMIELDSMSDSIQSINESRIEIGKLTFVGYQYSLPFMGGIFEKPEESIGDDLVALDSFIDECTVLVTHSPAYGILDKGILGRRAGSHSIRELVENKNPLLHIHGHIHEEFGVQGRHFNVAAAGHKRAILIDTDTSGYQALSESLA